MIPNLRSSVLLAVATLVICCVAYPAIVWAVARTAFRQQAEGDLVFGAKEDAVGSRLIAQPFSANEYFWPRPSAVGYNAAASGASNYAASNPRLRERAARYVGAYVKYLDGRPAAADVERWFLIQGYLFEFARFLFGPFAPTAPSLLPPPPVASWAHSSPASVQAWLDADTPGHDKLKQLVEQVRSIDPEKVKEFAVPSDRDSASADDVVPLFVRYAEVHPASWPVSESDPFWSIGAVFFDRWLRDNSGRAWEMQAVPADLVTASASGLDPHITLKAALYQLDRVAEACAEKTGTSKDDNYRDIEKLLRSRAEAPLGGLIGAPLINVLDINLELEKRLNKLKK
jgi:K+-transporting ATPase ATPase C chain